MACRTRQERRNCSEACPRRSLESVSRRRFLTTQQIFERECMDQRIEGELWGPLGMLLKRDWSGEGESESAGRE